MEKHEIETTVSKIIEGTSGICIGEEQYETDFFSKSISLTPFFLVYIFFALQDRFNLKFKEEDIHNGAFNTVSSITDLIINN